MEQNKSSIGSIIGTIVIIALIILGGLYFWGKRIEDSKAKEALISQTTQQPTSTENQEAAAIRSTSSSDDLNSIQTDINATNVDNLSPELN